MYYLCSENKGADQLRGYREADLRLCFRIFQKQVFSQRGSNWSYSTRKMPPKDAVEMVQIYRTDLYQNAPIGSI